MFYIIRNEAGKIERLANEITHEERATLNYSNTNGVGATFQEAEALADELTEFSGNKYLGVDRGAHTSPRYSVVEVPQIGEFVSYGFNGDYYPDDVVVRISASYRTVTTASGRRYHRRRLTGSWVNNGIWSMVKGHHNERNPSF